MSRIQYRIVGVKPCSTNDMYFSMPIQSKYKTYKNGKPRLSTRKIRTPELKKFQEVMSHELSSRIPDEFVEECQSKIGSGQYCIKLSIYVGMPEDNYKTSDSSNYIKAYEDCISRRLGVDDSHNNSVSSTKYLSTDWELLTDISLINNDELVESIKELGESINV